MRAYLIIIFQVRQQYVTEVPLSEHNNVVRGRARPVTMPSPEMKEAAN
jgi:hypothetical protein